MRITILAAIAVSALIQGCGSGTLDAPAATVAPDPGRSVQLASVEQPAATAKGRAQLWNENCPRCHNARPATFYSLREWEVAMHHMRVRCALTAEEHRKIVEFFKASK
jgi:septal ring-binding cell division protein DamX